MKNRQLSFIETNPLLPVGPAADLFIAGASVFEITVFEPPLQRVTVVGINLPEPDTFGPYDAYLATLVIPGEPEEELTSFILEPTLDASIWAGLTFLDFGGTLFPINAIVRPISLERMGPIILEGPVIEFENGNGEGEV